MHGILRPTFKTQFMKIFYLLAAIAILVSCKSSKPYLQRADEDKTLFDIVKSLNKRTDTAGVNALPIVYQKAEQRHLANIHAYNNYTDLSRWDKLAKEYDILQDMHDAIVNSDAASALVKPTNYQDQVYAVAHDAAEDYYQQGNDLLANGDRNGIKKAYAYFLRTDKWVPGYKDVKQKLIDAFNDATINVVITDVKDNSFFYNTRWGNSGYTYSNQYFQEKLVQDLGGSYATRYPARFYSEYQAQQNNIQPNWVIDLTLRNMDIPRPSFYNYSRNVSKDIGNSKDSTGKPIPQMVYATINYTKASFTARAEMAVDITDLDSHKLISSDSYRNDYNWENTRASYTGDKRAIDDRDWDIINNNRNDEPRKEDVLNELYRTIYSSVKSRIGYVVGW